MKPREKPSSKPTTPNGSRKPADENKWVWELYERIKLQMELAIVPLKEYLRSFDEYKDIL